jgi:hypothetical protein
MTRGLASGRRKSRSYEKSRFESRAAIAIVLFHMAEGSYPGGWLGSGSGPTEAGECCPSKAAQCPASALANLRYSTFVAGTVALSAPTLENRVLTAGAAVPLMPSQRILL